MKYKKINSTLLGAMVVTGAMGIASQAQAAAGYCDLGTATENISTANMSFNSIASSDCYGVVTGNISSTGGGNSDGPAELSALAWGTGWSFLAEAGAGANQFMGLSFTVTATPGVTGSWTLTGTDMDLNTPLNFPTSLDFIVSLKGGTEYALWGFDNAAVDGSDAGTFSIVFTNNGGNNPHLFHLFIFSL